jgi:hypothetical protein
MSYRTWLGSDNRQLADFCDFDFKRCEYDSLEALCSVVAWRLPAKVYSPTRELVDEFLVVMKRDYGMTWDDFFSITVMDDLGNRVEYTNTPTKASIEVMEMFGRFIDEIDKNGGI